jgi:hypothetical protein
MLNSLKLILENESSDEPLKIGQFKKTGKMSLTSADDQIDAYLMKLQAGAVEIKKEEEDKEENISESFSKRSLRTLLVEEGEAVDSSKIDVEDPAESETVAIDVSSFAKHIKEFVNLAHERLDIPSVIVNRARNLIKDKHPDALKAFDMALKDVQLGGETRFEDKPDDSFQTGAIGGGGV